MGDVLRFPSRQPEDVDPSQPVPSRPIPTCWTCRNATFGERGTYCTVFGEAILSEVVAAEDCETYDSIDEVRKS